jgi:glycine/D-amino acid oxidase-like deaminating enzyme
MDTTAYYLATHQSDELLREQQAEINAAWNAGSITAAQAADLRVVALESHLAACKLARHTHLEPRHDCR